MIAYSKKYYYKCKESVKKTNYYINLFLDLEKFESRSSSQSSEPVDYGTQPDAEVRSYEDFDWV